MLKLPRKADDTKYTAEEAAKFTLEDVKKFIEAEVPGAFSKKERKPKAGAKKKAAPKKKTTPRKKGK
jgi:DNA topoisomerase-1